MKICILVEDKKEEESFGSEHGLSIYFEKDGKRFLFDTGQSNLFIENAKKLGIDLAKTDYIILSHGHYDHSRGLTFLNLEGNTQIITHSHSIYPKYDGSRYIGFPQIKHDWSILLSEKLKQLTTNVCYLGEIPGEGRSGLGHHVRNNVKCVDHLLDDSAVAINDQERLVILSGCAHSGIVNIVKYAGKLFKPAEIILIGGFHMHKHTLSEINDIIKELKKLNVKTVYPGHCTGKNAIKAMLDSFKGERLYSGKVFEV
ncbi:MBL fold metallo-hydrolase [Candidatus Woesearchaeota archaeon]|nr:MBL fold metallo-hydrolase [Candidatus Woesearchaeota archaeon]